MAVVIAPNLYGYPDISIWDDTDPNCVYGALVESAQEDVPNLKCAVVRIQKVGTITKHMWSNGSYQRNQDWSQRASLTYKFLQ